MNYRNTKSLVNLLGVLFILGTLRCTTIKTNAQNQTANGIAERLELKGVPVRNVFVTSYTPFRIEIDLQSASNNDQMSMDESWFLAIAVREATLAYRYGERVSSYRLVVYNAKDEIIYSTETYLYPSDLSQNLPEPAEPKIDGVTAEEIVASQLQLGGLKLDKIEVISDYFPDSSGQILNIKISAENLEAANLYLSSLMDSLLQLLERINSEYGTYIVLCRLKLVDGQGNVLLDFIRDVEIGHQMWRPAKGLANEWYPHPPSEESLEEIIDETTPTSPPPANPYPPYP